MCFWWRSRTLRRYGTSTDHGPRTSTTRLSRVANQKSDICTVVAGDTASASVTTHSTMAALDITPRVTHRKTDQKDDLVRLVVMYVWKE